MVTVGPRSKRQRREKPPSWLENETLAFVASPLGDGTIRTTVASNHDKDLFLDRLEKEIVRPYYRSLKDTKETKHETSARKDTADQKKPASIYASVRKARIVMGTNQCTRCLENILAGSKGASVAIPSLIVLARDVYPPTMLSHVPVMVQRIRMQQQADDNNGTAASSSLPILLLPGAASQELGKLFGTKRVSVILFLPPAASSKKEDGATNEKLADARHFDEGITSFIQFVKKTIPLSS